MIAGDRGLAGDTMPIFLNVWRRQPKVSDYVVLPIGKKAVEYFRQRGDGMPDRTVFAEIAGYFGGGLF